MNRLSHLKQTLKQNIQDNQNYELLEFILLDYSSSDGLENYVKSELNQFVESGRLVYYRTEGHSKYSMSHSRNLAFKLATGDIICNIDADNFTGKGFASYINDEFEIHENIFLSTHQGEVLVKNDVLGRLCMKKKDFTAIGGYDERMIYYGFDDYDIINRLIIYGIKKRNIISSRFLNAIGHSNEDRMVNSVGTSNISSLYIKYVSPWQSKLVFLFSDNTVSIGTMINNFLYNTHVSHTSPKKSENYRYAIEEKFWQIGEWEINNSQLILYVDGIEERLQISYDKANLTTESKKLYYRIDDKKLLENTLFFYHQLYNRLIMEENILQGRFKVNQGIYGEGNVLKNFIENRITIYETN